MAYEKQNFENGKVLTAAHLNYIEDGIESVHDDMGDVANALDHIIALQEELVSL